MALARVYINPGVRRKGAKSSNVALEKVSFTGNGAILLCGTELVARP